MSSAAGTLLLACSSCRKVSISRWIRCGVASGAHGGTRSSAANLRGSSGLPASLRDRSDWLMSMSAQ